MDSSYQLSPIMGPQSPREIPSMEEISPTCTCLKGCTIYFCGQWSHSETGKLSTKAILKDLLLKPLGARHLSAFNNRCTHLVISPRQVRKRTVCQQKMQDKKDNNEDVHIVSLQWLQDCKNNGRRMPEDDYPVSPETLPDPATDLNSTRKRSVTKAAHKILKRQNTDAGRSANNSMSGRIKRQRNLNSEDDCLDLPKAKRRRNRAAKSIETDMRHEDDKADEKDNTRTIEKKVRRIASAKNGKC
jgi:hypothetical protein